MQGTGGSTAIANSWTSCARPAPRPRAPRRRGGEGVGRRGRRYHHREGRRQGPGGKSATFGELAGLAPRSSCAGPSSRRIRAPRADRPNKLPKVDTLPKTNGTAIYTIDVKSENMLTCLVARPSRFHATVKSFDAAPALAVPGVMEVVRCLAGRGRARRRLLGGEEGPRCAEGRMGRGRHGSARQRPDRQGVRRPRRQAGRHRPQ